MKTTNVLVFAAKGRDSLTSQQQQELEAVAQVQYVPALQTLPDQEIIRLCRDVEFIALTRRTTKNFHADLIAALPQLKGLSIYATGCEWVDQAALQRQGIALKFLPDYSMDSVAEHTVGMLLTMSRRIHLSDRVARADLPSSVSLRGWEIKGKTIGIIGMGRIGQRVAELLGGFGVRLIYFDIETKVIAPSLAVACTDLDELLAQADVVIACASMDRSDPVILGSSQLQRMQAHAILLNPGRAELVDKAAVLSALSKRKLAGYAIDDRIFSQQELADVEHGRVLQTGHTAWYSDEAMERGTQLWIQQLVELINDAKS